VVTITRFVTANIVSSLDPFVPDFPKPLYQTTIFFWIAPNIAKIKPLPALQGNAHRSSLQARLKEGASPTAAVISVITISEPILTRC